MTETEWATATDPTEILAFLRDHGTSERKLRLFAVVCCRRVWHLLTDERSRAAVDIAERAADGGVGDEELDAARLAATAADAAALQARHRDPARPEIYILAAKAANIACRPPGLADADAARAVVSACSLITRNPASGLDREAEFRAYCGALRDIFGNPFTLVQFDPSWRTSPVVAMAQGMYDRKDFGLMPVLADALADAGCRDETVLAHCRGAGLHVRGCFVVDLVLDRS